MKKIAISLSVFAVIVSGGVYFFNELSVYDTATDVLGSFSSWKTYDGKSKVGLTLKYPADWTFDDSFPDNVSFMTADGSNAFGAYRIKASKKKQTLAQWLKVKDKENKEAMGGQYNDYVISTKKSKVAKLAAVKRVEHADAAGFDFIQTYAKSGNYFYSLALGVGSSGFYTPADEKVYDKILSTVQFTK